MGYRPESRLKKDHLGLEPGRQSPLGICVEPLLKGTRGARVYTYPKTLAPRTRVLGVIELKGKVRAQDRLRRTSRLYL